MIEPELPLIVLQTPAARHLENDLYPAGAGSGHNTPLCTEQLDPSQVKRRRLRRVPTAAVCAECIRIARQWCGWWYFEPWDCTQRLRLLSNLTKDLAAVEGG